MKLNIGLKTVCANGNTVESWYDRKTKSYVTATKDQEGNQIGDAEYDGGKKSRAFSVNEMVKRNGGKI
jgi:Tfp pilus assembly protein PilX